MVYAIVCHSESFFQGHLDVFNLVELNLLVYTLDFRTFSKIFLIDKGHLWVSLIFIRVGVAEIPFLLRTPFFLTHLELHSAKRM